MRSETFRIFAHFVIPAPAFARVNSSGNPEGLEKTGFLLPQEWRLVEFQAKFKGLFAGMTA
jgi:hypothetical protein